MSMRCQMVDLKVRGGRHLCAGKISVMLVKGCAERWSVVRK
jgi:hypothetical protein